MSSLHLAPSLRRILLEAVILCALAMTVGLSINYRMVMDAFTGKTVVAAKNALPGDRSPSSPSASETQRLPDPVDMDELDELLAAGALLVDARSSATFAGQHLPGAISLPLEDVAARLDKFLAEVPKDRVLITYCNGFGCPDSFDLGVRLLAAGYRQVLVFEGGFPQWRDAGRPLEGEQ